MRQKINRKGLKKFKITTISKNKIVTRSKSPCKSKLKLFKFGNHATLI